MSIFTIRNPSNDPYPLSDLDLIIQANSSIDPLVVKELSAIRSSNETLFAISKEELIVTKNGIDLKPPSAITHLWGAFILRNVTDEIIEIKDMAFSIVPGEEYILSLKPDYKMRNSKDLCVNIGLEKIIASDGTLDLAPIIAIKHIFGIKGLGDSLKSDVVEIPDYLGNLNLVFVYLDYIRDKWLSSGEINLTFGDSLVQASDWVRHVPSQISHSDSGFKSPMSGTLTRVTMTNTEVKQDDTQIFMYLNDTKIITPLLNMDISDNYFVDSNLNIDFNAGDVIRLRASESNNGLSVKNLAIVAFIRWRYVG